MFGIIGYLMQKYEFPLSPILLALILGPMSEANFGRFMQIEQGNFMVIFTRPICVVFIVLSIGSMVFSVINQRKINKRTGGTPPGDPKVDDLSEAFEDGRGDAE